MEKEKRKWEVKKIRHSVPKSCTTPCDPMDCSMPSFPVLHHLLELTQTHVHWVGDAIQPSHPVVPFSSFLQSFPVSGLFQWISSLHQVAKVSEPQLWHQSFEWIFRVDFLQDWLVWSPCSPRDSQESSPAPQFKSINSLVVRLLHSPTLTSIQDYWNNHSLTRQNFVSKETFAF